MAAGCHAGGVKAELGLALGVGGDEFGAAIRQGAAQGAVRQRFAPVVGGLDGGFDGFAAEPDAAGDVERQLDFFQLELANVEGALELQGFTAFSFLPGGHRVLADGGGGGQHERGIEGAELAEFHRLFRQHAALRVVEADLECGVRRQRVGVLDDVAQNPAHGHGFARQIRGSIGVEVPFRLESGGKFQPCQRQVEGGGVLGPQRKHPHIG